MASYRLEELGWKAFQDLCGTIGREVWTQTLETFSEGADAGRDGAFMCDWNPNSENEFTGHTVIQCKHFTSSESSLTVGTIQDELSKIGKLAKRGICENYILISNGKLSGGNSIAICEAVLNAGAKTCRVYGADWVEDVITDNRKLRMLVPRVYGLGDLSEIIDERAYIQASTLLESLTYDIATFVPTNSYRNAAKNLMDHGLVLLLGEPAAGKSVIASTLALAATDQWQCLTIKADNAKDFKDHWNPNQPNQFFWIDDAFGATQFQEDLTNGWNSILILMRAAVERGAHIVITSRDYIWKSAQKNLKLGIWPELESGKVVVNVEEISLAEREGILYNHLRLGRQSHQFRSQIKSLPPAVAAHPRFLPELARRLASPILTTNLELTEKSLKEYFDRPEEFLLEVVHKLDNPSKAALTLLIMSLGGLPSPLSIDGTQRQVMKMLGVDEGSVRNSFSALNGSLVKLETFDDGSRSWVVRHPTIIDAVTSLILKEPELLEIYLRMAKTERLMREISCGIPRERSVQVPPIFFNLVTERLSELVSTSHKSLPMMLVSFLAFRCNMQYLLEYFKTQPHLIDRLLKPAPYLSYSTEVILLSELKTLGLLTSDHLDHLANHVEQLALNIPDAAPQTSIRLRNLLGQERTEKILDAVREKLPNEVHSLMSEWNENYNKSLSPEEYLSPLLDALDAFEIQLGSLMSDLINELQEIYDQNLHESFQTGTRGWDSARVSDSKSERTIFDDLDQ